jgi:predicted ATPase
MQALAHVLMLVAILAQFERSPSEVERRASDVIELSTRQIFATWLPGAVVLRGWAHSVSGDTAGGMALIQEGIENWRAPGSMHLVPYWLGLKAEVLHLAAYTPKALEAIMEAETLAERSEQRWWCAELHRLRGVFLAAIGTDEAQIEASLGEAIRIAREQKSISLQKRAEATCAEYRRQRASGSGERKFRLPLC